MLQVDNIGARELQGLQEHDFHGCAVTAVAGEPVQHAELGVTPRQDVPKGHGSSLPGAVRIGDIQLTARKAVVISCKGEEGELGRWHNP